MGIYVDDCPTFISLTFINFLQFEIYPLQDVMGKVETRKVKVQ